MARWTRKRVNSDNLNNGSEYGIDNNVAIEELNAIINSGLYSQDFAEKLVTNIDVSEAGNVGTPSVTFVDGDGATTDKPYKKFKFSNLKGEKGEQGIQGEKGDKGDKGDQGIQGEKGEPGLTGNGISSVLKTSSSGLVDTYTITFTNGGKTTFNVTNGTNISKIEKTSTSGLVDTYTITLTDNSTSTFTVTNGDEIELRVADGYFQWKYTTSDTWINLLSTSELSNVDAELSETSTNPVQNRVITGKFNDLDTNIATIGKEVLLSQNILDTGIKVCNSGYYNSSGYIIDMFPSETYKYQFPLYGEFSLSTSELDISKLNSAGSISVTLSLNGVYSYNNSPSTIENRYFNIDFVKTSQGEYLAIEKFPINIFKFRVATNYLSKNYSTAYLMLKIPNSGDKIEISCYLYLNFDSNVTSRPTDNANWYQIKIKSIRVIED